jgi:hypothetical protein
VGIKHDVAAKPHFATFTPRWLLSLNVPDERQMRPLHGLAKVASRQIEATESCRLLPWSFCMLDIRHHQTVISAAGDEKGRR